MKKYLQMVLILAVWNFCSNASSQGEQRELLVGKNYQQHQVGPERKNKNNKNNKNKQPGLHQAVLQGNEQEIIRLLSQSCPANINRQNYNGETALMLAVEKNNFEIFTLLADEQDLDITLKDIYGKTVVDKLLQKNRIDWIDFLQSDERFKSDIIKNIQVFHEKRDKRKQAKVTNAIVCLICQEKIKKNDKSIFTYGCKAKHQLHELCKQEAVSNGYIKCFVCEERGNTTVAAQDMLQSDEGYAQWLQYQFYQQSEEQDTDDEAGEADL